jgi:adenylate cyclase
MADIFVSYASEDFEQVKPLVRTFEGYGWSVWWDKELVAGPSFYDKIEEALDMARCVVVVWSNSSIRSRWVKAEANEGLEREILVPLLSEDVKPPLAFRISQTAAMLDWPDQTGQLQSVIDGISEVLGKPPTVNLPTPTQENSIAVLPFTNMSSDPEQEYFSDGMAEEVINGLVSLPHLKVIARTSSFQFKDKSVDIREIGKRLNVTHIIEGSVRKEGTRIRVTAQLIQVSDGMHLWSNRFDRELADTFTLQDEITNEILESLPGQLPDLNKPTNRTIMPDAYDAYLLGRYHRIRGHLDNAAGFFEQAISLDPEYADAYAELALITLNYLQLSLKPKDYLQPLIDDYTAKALAVNPTQSLLLVLKAWASFSVGHHQQSINDVCELVKQRPNDSELLSYYSEFFVPVQRLDESIRILKRCVELDPLNPSIHLELTGCLLQQEKFSEAQEMLESAKSLGANAILLESTLAANKRDMESLKNLVNKSNTEWGVFAQFRPIFEATIVLCEGNEELVKGILTPVRDSLENQSSFFKHLVAKVEGKTELALDYYAEAIESSDSLAISQIHGTPFERDLYPDFYDHSRYIQLLKKNGLDKETTAALKIPRLSL